MLEAINNNNSFETNKINEFIGRLKLLGISIDGSDIKNTEKKIKEIETFYKKTKIGFVDLHFTKEDIKPMLTSRNITKFLEHYKISLVYDEIKKTIFAYDNDNKEINFNDFMDIIEDDLYKHNFQIKSYDVLLRKVTNIAYRNKINPVKDFILNAYEKNKNNIDFESLEIDRVFKTIKGRKEDEQINYLLYRTFMLSTVSCQFNDDFKSQGSLTFNGNQGLGKSSWCSNLIPETLRKTYFKEEFALNTREKDNYIESVQYWIVELSELGRTVKDSDRAKSHITKNYDEYRMPYDRTPVKHKRMTTYISSVDKDDFLKDDENRRWWTIKVIDRFDLEYKINHELLFAELYHFYLQDTKKCHVLTFGGLNELSKHNKEFNITDDTDSIILNMFDWESENRYYVPVSVIGTLINNEKINNTRIGCAMKKLGINFIQPDKKTKQKLYAIPAPRKIRKWELSLFEENNFEKVIDDENQYKKEERQAIQEESELPFINTEFKKGEN